MVKKVTTTNKRKTDHLEINLHKDVRSLQTTGFDYVAIVHEALPEVNYKDIDLSLELFGRRLNYPLLISSMTGGTDYSARINQQLAEVAQYYKIAMGVGSQRIALEEQNSVRSFSITRSVAPDILLFANLGAIQLNKGYTIDHCKRAVDMIEADALVLHLNPLQETIQMHGDTEFAGLARKIEQVCKHIDIPVIAKEVGSGISKRTAKLLSDCGVSVIDVGGAGGTSWSQVEMYRASNETHRQLAESFKAWGIPTVRSIINVKEADPNMMIFASGGILNGLDITKSLALGAVLGGIAGPILRAVAISEENLLEFIKLTIDQIRVSMFCCGASNLSSLNTSKVEILS